MLVHKNKIRLLKAGWFLNFLVIIYSFLPPWWTILRVFFPQDFCLQNIKQFTKFDLYPKIWKDPHPLGIISQLFTPRFFFFRPNPEGEKNVNYLLPNYFFRRSTFLYVTHEIYTKPYIFAVLLGVNF